jgi:type IV pilus assembly protein PilB
VEYHIDGINQVQINEKTGMTFARALRAVLRQDPDIIAVGEIRDGETAEIAIRAAITGHLVLSTVHTFDAISTIDRLVDIGVEPYLIASGVRGIISQRLVRCICPHCMEAYAPAPEEFAALNLQYNPSVKFFRGVGCPLCFSTGYRGRTGVFEILIIDRALRSEISKGASRETIQEAIKRSSNFQSMEDSLRRLVFEGRTTLSEARKTMTAME